MIAASHILTPDTRSIDWRQPVNWANPLNHGLVSWWLAIPNHTSGTSTWRDLCVKNDGTLTNFANVDTAWQTQGQPGGFGALGFDGTDDYVDVPDSPGLRMTGDAFTLSVLGRPTNAAFAGAMGVSKKAGPLWNQSSGWTIYHNDQYDIVDFITDTPASSADYARFSGLAANYDTYTQYLITGIRGASRTSVAFYVNGDLYDDTKTPLNIVGATDTVRIGQRDPGSYAECRTADVRIWDRALTASEIQDYYHRSQRYYPGLLNRPSRRSVFAPSTGTTITPATLSISAALQGSPPVSSRTIEVT